MKRIIFTLVLLVLCLVGIFLYFIIHKNKTSTSTPTSTSRIFKPFPGKEIGNVELGVEAHRIISSQDSIILLHGKTISIYGIDLQHSYNIQAPFKQTDGNYYAYRNLDTQAFFNIDYKKLYIENPNLKDSFSFYKNESPENSIYNSNNFFTQITDSSGNVSFIESLNPNDHSKKKILNLNTFFASELLNYKDCITHSLEGNFFSIGQNSFGFFFYRSGYFIIYDNGSFKKVKTAVDYPFIKFEIRKLEGMANAYSCYTEKDIQVQLGCCSNGDRIFMLSNIGDKTSPKQRIMDIYERNGKYIQSEFLPNNSKGSKPLGIGCSLNNIFVQYDDYSIISYKL